MKIATVCGMGFGTSMMLAIQVRRLVADEGVQASVDPVDLASFKSMHADIVIAPRDMEHQVSGGSAKYVVLIDNLVDRDEVSTKVLDVIRSLPS